MATEIEAGKHLMYHAAWLAQHGKPFGKEAAMAKLFCSELAMRATIKAVQLHGGYGYTKDYPVERYHARRQDLRDRRRDVRDSADRHRAARSSRNWSTDAARRSGGMLGRQKGTADRGNLSVRQLFIL